MTPLACDLKERPSDAKAMKTMLRRTANPSMGGASRGNWQQVTTSGGRVLAVTAVGPCISEARERAYVAVRAINFNGVQYRKDIAENVDLVVAPRAPSKKEAAPVAATYLSAGVDLHLGDAISAGIQPFMQQTRRTGCEPEPGSRVPPPIDEGLVTPLHPWTPPHASPGRPLAEHRKKSQEVGGKSEGGGWGGKGCGFI